jgi:hypothetical protein
VKSPANRHKEEITVLKKRALVVALAVLAIGEPVLAAQQPVVTTITVNHVRYHTARPYADVKADLEQKVGRVEGSFNQSVR